MFSLPKDLQRIDYQTEQYEEQDDEVVRPIVYEDIDQQPPVHRNRQYEPYNPLLHPRSQTPVIASELINHLFLLLFRSHRISE